MAFPYVFQNNEDNEDQASGELVNGLQIHHNCSIKSHDFEYEDQESGKIVNGLQINHNFSISQDFEYEHHRYINYDQSYSSSAVTGTPDFPDLEELVSLLINDDLPIKTNHCRSNSHHEEEEDYSAGEDLAEDSPAEASIEINPVVSRNHENGNPNLHLNCESYTGDNYEQFNPHTHDDDLYHHHHHHHYHRHDPVSSSPSPSPTINPSHDEMHGNWMGMHTNHHHYHASMAQLPLRVPPPPPAVAAAPLYNDGPMTLSFAQQPSPSPYETSNCSFTASSYGSYHNIASPLDVSSSPIGTSKKRKATKSAIDDCFEDHERIGIIVQTINLSLPDGYVWRKYGQKIIKHEEHSRSYYKCAHDGCTVKKHIQQQSKSEVMFTYEGKHNHPAPNS